MPQKGRPVPHVLAVPWQADDPCPCGVKGRQWGACCLHSDGAPLVQVPVITTPGSKTGHANEGCYCSFTDDCSEKLSKEHYISESVLGQFGESVRVSGFPWEPDGYSKVRSVGTLTSPVLCERHNNALAPLDAYAGLSFQAISSAVMHATKDSVSERTAIFVASGDALERWAIKTLLGLVSAGVASAEREPMLKRFKIDFAAMADVMFGRRTHEPPLGLYVSKRVGEVVGNKVAFAPIYAPELNQITGLKMYMRGVEFDAVLDARGLNDGSLIGNPNYRPGIIDFDGPQRTGRIVLSWAKHRLKGRQFGIALARERVLGT
jgi:hypothetical protein